MKNRSVPAAKFKAQCLGLLDEVARGRTELVITKDGKPIARVVPLEKSASKRKLGGQIHGDIVHMGEPEWLA